MTQVEKLPNGGWDERIHVFKFGRLVRCFAVVTERYLILIDNFINPATAAVMMEPLEKFLAGRQLLVINTHSDWDHCWGNQLFVGADARYPAPIIASKACAEKFGWEEATSYLVEMREKEPSCFADVRLVPPTIVFDNKMTIDGGDLTLELFPAPGHTHDQIGIYVPEIKTLFAADATERPFPEARKPEFMPQLRQTLADLASYDANVVLCCHADDTDGKVIADNIAYFDFLEQRIRDAGVALPEDDSADLATLINCPFAAAMSQDPNADTYSDHYKTTAHNNHIRAVWQQVTDV